MIIVIHYLSLSILKIYDIYKIETLKFVHACINKTNPAQFHNYYTYHNSNYNTRSIRDKLLKTPQPRTLIYGLKSLKYNGVILWNDLNLIFRILTSAKQFISKVKNQYLTSYSNNV